MSGGSWSGVVSYVWVIWGADRPTQRGSSGASDVDKGQRENGACSMAREAGVGSRTLRPCVKSPLRGPGGLCHACSDGPNRAQRGLNKNKCKSDGRNHEQRQDDGRNLAHWCSTCALTACGFGRYPGLLMDMLVTGMRVR